MKKTLSILLIGLLVSTGLISQNKEGKLDDQSRVALNVFITDEVLDEIPASAVATLTNRLNQAITKNGLGSNSIFNRFILTPNVNLLSKDITPTVPPMHVYTVELSLYSGDGYDGTLFKSATVNLKGVGDTEAKAYLAAFKQLKSDNPEIQKMLRETSKKIIEYYNTKCDFILKEAEMLRASNQYDQAIYLLISIPEVCKECYDKAMDKVAVVYKEKIEYDCKVLLNNANNAWNISQNLDGANNAASFLIQIDPTASCFNEAKQLSNKIAKKVNEIEKRDWDFQMRAYKDGVDIIKQQISAARDIGVAFGSNQPRTIYNIRGWW
ncbi:MAG: hypothetical protein WBH98_05625 [Bacteroidales bacterium]